MPLAEIIPVEDLTDQYDLGEEQVKRLLRNRELIGFKLGRRRYVHVDDWNAYIDRLRAAQADDGTGD